MPQRTDENTAALHAQAEYLLDRYGVITRGAVTAEALPGGFSAYYRLLAKMEETGHIRRGYFIDGLGAAQFSTAATIDALRAYEHDPNHPQAVGLAATDPANPTAPHWTGPPPKATVPEEKLAPMLSSSTVRWCSIWSAVAKRYCNLAKTTWRRRPPH